MRILSFRIKAFFLLPLICLALQSCGEGKKNLPDVSAIPLKLELIPFHTSLSQIDSSNAPMAINGLFEKYPRFAPDYFYNILGLPPFPDSVRSGTLLFLDSYRPIIDSAVRITGDLDPQIRQLEMGLKYCKYWFPQYQVPIRIFTFIGPFDGYGSVLSQDGFGVGLQLYLGPGFSAYQSGYIQNFYPAYRSRRFEKAYIPADCMRNLISDLHPQPAPGANLLEQMVDLGKRLYLLDYMLPNLADTIKTGYTQKQLDLCYENEAVLWNFYLTNELLYKTDGTLLRDYLNDGPQTTVFGPEAPGNIAQFTGWQMVRAWAGKTGNQTNMQVILSTPAAQILREGNYKPR